MGNLFMQRSSIYSKVLSYVAVYILELEMKSIWTHLGM